MNLREKLFWILDARLRQGTLARELATVTQLQNNGHAGGAIDDLLRFAVREVPFYSGFDSAQGLQSFPVLNKSQLRRADSTLHSPAVALGVTHVASTSGSTGTPLRVHHDVEKRRRIAAEAVYWGNAAGYRVGVPLYHLKVWSDRNKIPFLRRIAQNVRPIDVVETSARSMTDRLVRLALGNRAVSIIAYGTALESVARVLEGVPRVSPSGRIRSIISQSEPLSAEAREILADRLGAVPMNRYGMEEVGIIAQQLPGAGNLLRINCASMVVEILREEDDRPALPGKVGRIVVTDLVNRAQPIIRYDTGDLGSFAVRDGKPDTQWLAQIEGRRTDRILNTQDEPLPAMLMYRVWWKYPEITQYQVVQHDKARYEIRLGMEAGSFDEAALVRDFVGLVGERAEVAVTRLDLARREPGKHRVIVRHYRPEV